MAQTKPQVSIDIVSDIACPWCFVGKKKLQQAIESLQEKASFTLHWHPYQLDPTCPPEGIPHQEYMRRKFGTPNQRMFMYMNYLTETGAKCGIDFCHFAEAKPDLVVANTFEAHRLMVFAQKSFKDRSDHLMNALFSGYLEKGLNVGRKDVLARLANDVGLPMAEVIRFLDSEEAKEEVRKKDEEAKFANITGVPHFTIKGPLLELRESELRSLSLRQLKTKLHLRGIDDTECVEKSDLVQRILETNHKEKPKIEVLSGAQDPATFIEAIENVLRP